jgi:hypothetical protein
MWQLYLYSFLAGLFGANGVPHFVKGVLGEKHQTPFGKTSSAAVNVAWGWLNFVVAGLLVYQSGFHEHVLRAFGMVAIGALLGGLGIGAAWSKHPARK